MTPADPGLQAECTTLAWNRPGLAVFANALLALRSEWAGHQAHITALAFALLAAVCAATLYGAWRRRHLLNSIGTIAPPTYAIGLAAVVTLIARATGLASVLTR